MPKSKSKPKSKNRKAAKPDSAIRLLSMAAVYPTDDRIKITVKDRLSFEKIKIGSGVEADFYNLWTLATVTRERCIDINPDELLLTANLAVDALCRTWVRYKKTGRMGFDGPAISQVADAIDLHEEILTLSTPLQMINAGKRVDKNGK